MVVPTPTLDILLLWGTFFLSMGGEYSLLFSTDYSVRNSKFKSLFYLKIAW